MKSKKLRSLYQIKSLVERGFAINHQLLVLNKEFKKIKDRLKSDAVSRPHERLPLLNTEGGGEEWIVRTEICECRIVFPAAQIKTDLDPSQPLFLSVKGLAGNHFNTLFRKVTTFEAREKKGFRCQVSTLLNPKDSAQLLNLCSSPSEPKAIWKAFPAGKEQS
jgi:hypothetical protein